ncbi:MAG: sigma-70 family RNA polymerase sigma factor [Bacteroidetes bacterium]|jgi:RNA polymerase sigma-70 factor (ECF subfamily)|nr:sigma-70 family RNA polymerase sigma factor [Bacteroidota bacterium]
MNAKTYNRIVDNYADGLYRYLLKNMQSPANAEDVVQTTFCRLWENREQIDLDRVKIWLFTVGHRLMIDAFRRQKPTTPVLPLHLESEDQEGRWELKELLNKALDHLPSIQRQLVTLRDYEGYAYSELAEITNLSESQVKVYLFRARRKLRLLLKSQEETGSQIKRS